MTKHKIFFHVETGHAHGYDHTRITVFSNEHCSLDDRIEGCVDNKAGYGTAEAAEKMGACYSRLKELGYTREADKAFMSARVVLHFQHYRAHVDAPLDYCEPRIELHDKYEDIKKGTALMEKVMRKASKRMWPDRRPEPSRLSIDTPKRVILALGDLKATEVDEVKAGPDSWDMFYVYPARRRLGAQEAA
jgi:hypothetical protein